MCNCDIILIFHSLLDIWYLIHMMYNNFHPLRENEFEKQILSVSHLSMSNPLVEEVGDDKKTNKGCVVLVV